MRFKGDFHKFIGLNFPLVETIGASCKYFSVFESHLGQLAFGPKYSWAILQILCWT